MQSQHLPTNNVAPADSSIKASSGVVDGSPFTTCSQRLAASRCTVRISLTGTTTNPQAFILQQLSTDYRLFYALTRGLSHSDNSDVSAALVELMTAQARSSSESSVNCQGQENKNQADEAKKEEEDVIKSHFLHLLLSAELDEYLSREGRRRETHDRGAGWHGRRKERSAHNEINVVGFLRGNTVTSLTLDGLLDTLPKEAVLTPMRRALSAVIVEGQHASCNRAVLKHAAAATSNDDDNDNSINNNGTCRSRTCPPHAEEVKDRFSDCNTVEESSLSSHHIESSSCVNKDTPDQKTRENEQMLTTSSPTTHAPALLGDAEAASPVFIARETSLGLPALNELNKGNSGEAAAEGSAAAKTSLNACNRDVSQRHVQSTTRDVSLEAHVTEQPLIVMPTPPRERNNERAAAGAATKSSAPTTAAEGEGCTGTRVSERRRHGQITTLVPLALVAKNDAESVSVEDIERAGECLIERLCELLAGLRCGAHHWPTWIVRSFAMLCEGALASPIPPTTMPINNPSVAHHIHLKADNVKDKDTNFPPPLRTARELLSLQIYQQKSSERNESDDCGEKEARKSKEEEEDGLVGLVGKERTEEESGDVLHRYGGASHTFFNTTVLLRFVAPSILRNGTKEEEERVVGEEENQDIGYEGQAASVYARALQKVANGQPCFPHLSACSLLDTEDEMAALDAHMDTLNAAVRSLNARIAEAICPKVGAFYEALLEHGLKANNRAESSLPSSSATYLHQHLSSLVNAAVPTQDYQSSTPSSSSLSLSPVSLLAPPLRISSLIERRLIDLVGAMNTVSPMTSSTHCPLLLRIAVGPTTEQLEQQQQQQIAAGESAVGERPHLTPKIRSPTAENNISCAEGICDSSTSSSTTVNKLWESFVYHGARAIRKPLLPRRPPVSAVAATTPHSSPTTTTTDVGSGPNGGSPATLSTKTAAATTAICSHPHQFVTIAGPCDSVLAEERRQVLARKFMPSRPGLRDANNNNNSIGVVGVQPHHMQSSGLARRTLSAGATVADPYASLSDQAPWGGPLRIQRQRGASLNTTANPKHEPQQATTSVVRSTAAVCCGCASEPAQGFDSPRRVRASTACGGGVPLLHGGGRAAPYPRTCAPASAHPHPHPHERSGHSSEKAKGAVLVIHGDLLRVSEQTLLRECRKNIKNVRTALAEALPRYRSNKNNTNNSNKDCCYYLGGSGSSGSSSSNTSSVSGTAVVGIGTLSSAEADHSSSSSSFSSVPFSSLPSSSPSLSDVPLDGDMIAHVCYYLDLALASSGQEGNVTIVYLDGAAPQRQQQQQEISSPRGHNEHAAAAGSSGLSAPVLLPSHERWLMELFKPAAENPIIPSHILRRIDRVVFKSSRFEVSNGMTTSGATGGGLSAVAASFKDRVKNAFSSRLFSSSSSRESLVEEDFTNLNNNNTNNNLTIDESGGGGVRRTVSSTGGWTMIGASLPNATKKRNNGPVFDVIDDIDLLAYSLGMPASSEVASLGSLASYCPSGGKYSAPCLAAADTQSDEPITGDTERFPCADASVLCRVRNARMLLSYLLDVATLSVNALHLDPNCPYLAAFREDGAAWAAKIKQYGGVGAKAALRKKVIAEDGSASSSTAVLTGTSLPTALSGAPWGFLERRRAHPNQHQQQSSLASSASSPLTPPNAQQRGGQTTSSTPTRNAQRVSSEQCEQTQRLELVSILVRAFSGDRDALLSSSLLNNINTSTEKDKHHPEEEEVGIFLEPLSLPTLTSLKSVPLRPLWRVVLSLLWLTFTPQEEEKHHYYYSLLFVTMAKRLTALSTSQSAARAMVEETGACGGEQQSVFSPARRNGPEEKDEATQQKSSHSASLKSNLREWYGLGVDGDDKSKVDYDAELLTEMRGLLSSLCLFIKELVRSVGITNRTSMSSASSKLTQTGESSGGDREAAQVSAFSSSNSASNGEPLAVQVERAVVAHAGVQNEEEIIRSMLIDLLTWGENDEGESKSVNSLVTLLIESGAIHVGPSSGASSEVLARLHTTGAPASLLELMTRY